MEAGLNGRTAGWTDTFCTGDVAIVDNWIDALVRRSCQGRKSRLGAEEKLLNFSRFERLEETR